MKSLLGQLGDSVTASGNILISNREEECGAMLLVKALPEVYTVTIDRDDRSVYEASLAGKEMPVDFIISREMLLNLSQMYQHSLFDMAVLYTKFRQYDWYNTEVAAQRILAINASNYSLKLIFYFLGKVTLKQMRAILDEARDPLEEFKKLL